MPALVAGIHVLNVWSNKDVDGRDKPGHDESFVRSEIILDMRPIVSF